jgi:hypothetical protein
MTGYCSFAPSLQALPTEGQATLEDLAHHASAAAPSLATPEGAVDSLDAEVVVNTGTITPWTTALPPVLELRRSSRLVNSKSANYVSMVDRAMARKKSKMEGSGKSDNYGFGELPAEELIAVVVKDEAR